MKRKTKQANLFLYALIFLIAILVLPRLGMRTEPMLLLNQFGVTSRDLVAAAIGAGLMYLFLKQR
jgi:hypothetical protein